MASSDAPGEAEFVTLIASPAADAPHLPLYHRSLAAYAQLLMVPDSE